MNPLNKLLFALCMILLCIVTGCSWEEPERETSPGNDRPAIRTTTGNNPRPHRVPASEE